MSGLFDQFDGVVEDGRVTIPAPLRNLLQDEGLFVCRGLFPCLFVLTQKKWGEIWEMYEKVPLMDVEGLKIQQHFGRGRNAALDRQGRLFVPQHLWDWAGIDRSCKICGAIERIEIWSPEKLEQYQQNTLTTDAVADILTKRHEALIAAPPESFQ
jgi:MraZ protein